MDRVAVGIKKLMRFDSAALAARRAELYLENRSGACELQSIGGLE
jgi:hypothetical protein